MNISPETLRFIWEHADADVRALALQAHKYPDVDMPVAIAQIAGRRRAAGKIPSWAALEGIGYPAHLSLEQCSSERTARYKASLLSGGDRLVDLTGGFGVDCAFLASRFDSATYVERQPELCALAAHNFHVLGLAHIRVVQGDGTDYLRNMEPADVIFADPARRDKHGGRVVSLKDADPDVTCIESLLVAKARRVLLKLSPMLDLSQALRELNRVHEVHIVSVDNECKELLLLLAGDAPPAEIPVRAVNLTAEGEQSLVFTREEEQRCEGCYAPSVGTFLYEPNASLLKGGAYRLLTERYPVAKLHPNSHLYTSEEPVRDFPGRSFRVTGQCGFGKKELRELTGGLGKANLSVRNFPASVAELRKRTGLSEGGDTYLFATTLCDGRKTLIRCEREKADAAGNG